MKNRVVIIGIDGVSYTLMDDLSKRGVMPNFLKLKGEGVFKPMASSIPANSAVSWSTIITGKNPGEHGIYGFSDMIKGSYTMAFPNFLNLKAKPFWEGSGTYVIINVPMTYPVKKMKGCHISGFISLDLEKAIYPKEVFEHLQKIDYKVDVDSEKGHKSKRLLLEDLFKVLEKRVEAYRYLWKKYDWDVFMFVLTGTDRLEHFLWEAYENPRHEHHKDFLAYFQKVDEAIGEIAGRMEERDSLMMLSDHGMETVKYNVNLNAVLAKEGLLKLGKDPKKRYNNMLVGTKVFALEDGRIYLNRKGRYPRGELKESEVATLLEQITRLFTDLKKDGKKVIRAVYTRDELYRGPQMNNAPDLVLAPNTGFNLRGRLAEEIFEESPLSGMHSPEAFIYVKSKNKVSAPEKPSVADVVPILNKLLGD